MGSREGRVDRPDRIGISRMRGRRDVMMTTKRICITICLAVATLLAVPAVAGAADTACYTECVPPSVSPNTVPLPYPVAANPTTTAQVVNGSSALPFTGADYGELAVVGLGAVVIGGVLTRRRRQAS